MSEAWRLSNDEGIIGLNSVRRWPIARTLLNIPSPHRLVRAWH